jgi:hypothetical protein
VWHELASELLRIGLAITTSVAAICHSFERVADFCDIHEYS